MPGVKKTDVLWDDDPVDIISEANFIWSIANKLRGSYMPDKYGDVIIPITIICRFECVLERTKQDVVNTYKKNPNYPAKAMQRISRYQFCSTSRLYVCGVVRYIMEKLKCVTLLFGCMGMDRGEMDGISYKKLRRR